MGAERALENLIFTDHSECKRKEEEERERRGENNVSIEPVKIFCRTWNIRNIKGKNII